MATAFLVKKFSTAATLQTWLTANDGISIDAYFSHHGMVLVYHV